MPPLPARVKGDGQRFTDWGQVRVRSELRDMDPEDVGLTTNPRQSVERGFEVNCTSCVTAYEARRRGLDVVAAPTKNGRGRTAPEWLEFYRDPATGARPTLKKATRLQLEKAAADAPDGARYIVQCIWKGRGRAGHVFTAEKVNGRLVYVEPQMPEYVDASKHWESIRTAAYVRVDDKELTDSALEAVMDETADARRELGEVRGDIVRTRVEAEAVRGAAKLRQVRQTRAVVDAQVEDLRAEAVAARGRGKKPTPAAARKAEAALREVLEYLERVERSTSMSPDRVAAIRQAYTASIDRWKADLR